MSALRERLSAICAQSEGTVGVAVTQLERGESVEVNGEALFPLCSTFKVPILVELLRQAAAGRFSLDDRVELDPGIQVAGSGLLSQMRPGLRPTLYDCALLMIVVSDNTATDRCLWQVGIERVGRLLAELGLRDTHITMSCRDIIFDVNGIADKSLTIEAFRERVRARGETKPDPNTLALRNAPPNNVGSPRDHTRLYELIWRGEALAGEWRETALDILLKQQLNQRLPRYLPDGVRFAHKTGSLPGVKNDAGIMYIGDDNHVAVSAFSRGLTPSHRQDRNDDLLAEIGRAVYDHYAPA